MSLLTFIEKAIRSYIRRVNRKNNKIIVDAIKKLPIETSITLVDVGAAGDIEPRWKKIEPVLKYIGFEPDERSNVLLQKKTNNCLQYQILPYALWDKKGTIDINLCSAPQVSSHYFPNRNFLDLFPNAKRFNIESTVTLHTEKLDDLAIGTADFMKLDIQGGELNAIKGAERLLQKTLGLEVEVEFLPLYSKQPLFGEISDFLSKSDFEFIDFVCLIRWQRKAHNAFGQCMFADALFLKSPERIVEIARLDDLVLSKYLSICLLYNRYDLIDRVMELIGTQRATIFDNFIRTIQPLKEKEKKLIKMNSWASKFIRLYGNEYKVHVTY